MADDIRSGLILFGERKMVLWSLDRALAIWSLVLLSTSSAQADLVRKLNTSGLKAVMQAGGLSIVNEISNGFVISQQDGPQIFVILTGCDEAKDCVHIQARGVRPIGTRPLARAGVEKFIDSVPIAFVSMREQNGTVAAYVGRDVWLAPGREPANIVNEIKTTIGLTGSMTSFLAKEDPGIIDFWKAQSNAR